MVALLIFGMLSAAGVALLSFSVRAQDAADVRLGALAQTRRAGALLTADLAQAAPRVSRDESGAAQRAFEGGTGQGETRLLAFVRRGRAPLDGAPRPSLEKVEYSLAGDRLQRRAFRYVDGAAAGDFATVMDGVGTVRLRYRDKQGQWRERWDPQFPAELPRAVEVVLTVRSAGAIRQLFLVGPGA